MRVKCQISGFAHGGRKSAPIVHVELSLANSDLYFSATDQKEAILPALIFVKTKNCSCCTATTASVSTESGIDAKSIIYIM